MHLPHGPGLTKLSFPCYRVCVFGSVSDFWLSVCLSLVYESVKISITTIDNNRESLVMPADCVVWSLCGGGELIPQTAFSVASAVWVCVCVCESSCQCCARCCCWFVCMCIGVNFLVFTAAAGVCTFRCALESYRWHCSQALRPLVAGRVAAGAPTEERQVVQVDEQDQDRIIYRIWRLPDFVTNMRAQQEQRNNERKTQ